MVAPAVIHDICHERPAPVVHRDAHCHTVEMSPFHPGRDFSRPCPVPDHVVDLKDRIFVQEGMGQVVIDCRALNIDFQLFLFPCNPAETVIQGGDVLNKNGSKGGDQHGRLEIVGPGYIQRICSRTGDDLLELSLLQGDSRRRHKCCQFPLHRKFLVALFVPLFELVSDELCGNVYGQPRQGIEAACSHGQRIFIRDPDQGKEGVEKAGLASVVVKKFIRTRDGVIKQSFAVRLCLVVRKERKDHLVR